MKAMKCTHRITYAKLSSAIEVYRYCYLNEGHADFHEGKIGPVVVRWVTEYEPIDLPDIINKQLDDQF